MKNYIVRRARTGDEPSIAKVHIRSWQETYKNLVPQAYLDELPAELDERIQMWKNILANPKRWAWVAEIEKEIVGFILFGPARDSGREGFIELGAVYLLASGQGKGIGFHLVSEGFKQMKELGYEKAYCWVLEGNKTIQFYERTGARPSHQTKEDEIGGKIFNEFAYEWDSLDF